jgi:protein-disulfide isomerase
MTQATLSSRSWTMLVIVGILLALAAGLLTGRYWQGHGTTPADPANKAAVEQIVHDYILDHPEILPQAMENLQQRDNAQALSGISDEVRAPFPGAVLGNPQGKVTLVEFTDYACTFCRQSVAEVEQLIAANPDLRVVVRELPILSPQSADAAKMALAAAEQGKYAAFHSAMFAAGHLTPDTIASAARTAGLDMARAQKTIADPRVESELAHNIDFARTLGFNGTPSWIAGDRLLSGAIGKDKLGEAVAAARKG